MMHVMKMKVRIGVTVLAKADTDECHVWAYEVDAFAEEGPKLGGELSVPFAVMRDIPLGKAEETIEQLVSEAAERDILEACSVLAATYKKEG